MYVGFRNRLMRWAGNAVAYQPGQSRHGHRGPAGRCADGVGAALAIAGEGRIFVGESVIRPLSDGPAFLALRTGVPVVPVTINGTGWLGSARRIRVRIGEPVPTARPRPAPRRGRRDRGGPTGRWPNSSPMPRTCRRPVAPGAGITELFNDWPEGARPEPPRTGNRTSVLFAPARARRARVRPHSGILGRPEHHEESAWARQVWQPIPRSTGRGSGAE